ncbi:MAG: ABC transporter permease [Proteobacteria bacterium]|nr:ABC transporter permease [Pseudomonadota bacterium]
MRYFLNRIGLLFLTLLLISIVTFVITNILPGDVATMILGTRSSPEKLAALQNALGLNDPLVVQYGRWIWGLLQGDLGSSLRFKVPIAGLIGQKILASGMVVFLSLFIAIAFAVPLGVIGAIWQNRWQDTVSSGLALTGISLPDFFWGIVLILVVSRMLGWLPSSGYVSPAVNFWSAIAHSLLPAIALGFSLMAQLTRMTRSAMLEVISQDFIRVCRAKGLGEGSVILKHALRNAIAPVVTVAGLQLGYLFGSIIVVETLFNYTGMGWLTYQGLINRDIPLIQATIFVIATVFMISNLIVDLIYTALDPRISFD